MSELDLKTLSANMDLSFARKMIDQIQVDNEAGIRAIEATRRAKEAEELRRHNELVAALKEAGDKGATIIIGDNAQDIQIQQNSPGAKQKKTVSEGLDYEQAKIILCEIKEYFELPKFKETFGDNAENIKNVVEDTLEAISNNEDEGLIKKSLRVIRDIAYNVGGNLIASGIIALVSQLPIG